MRSIFSLLKKEQQSSKWKHLQDVTSSLETLKTHRWWIVTSALQEYCSLGGQTLCLCQSALSEGKTLVSAPAFRRKHDVRRTEWCLPCFPDMSSHFFLSEMLSANTEVLIFRLIKVGNASYSYDSWQTGNKKPIIMSSLTFLDYITL